MIDGCNFDPVASASFRFVFWVVAAGAPLWGVAGVVPLGVVSFVGVVVVFVAPLVFFEVKSVVPSKLFVDEHLHCDLRTEQIMPQKTK